MNVLALEASTSSAKAIIYSSSQGIVAAKDQAYDEGISNVTTQEPEGVYRALMECGRSLLESFEGNIDAIALSSTWHSLLLIDKGGKPIGRTLTWANNQAAETVDSYKKNRDLTNEIYRKTGCPVHTTFPLWKWIHAKEKGGIYRNSVLISSQPEYIFQRMTGERGVSYNVASGTGFMNIHNLDWDHEILEFAKLSLDQLAPLREAEFSAPLKDEAADFLNVKRGIPVVITGADGAMNQIGAGAMGDGIMTMSVGTSGAIRMATSHPVIPQTPSTWCYYVAEGKRLAGAATSGAGNCVNWFVNRFNNRAYSYDELENMIDKDRLMDAPIFLPFMYGERSPGWRGARLGGFQEIRDHHDLGDFYYSILEGVLFNLYQCYQILTSVGGVPEEIRISGGIENSPWWLQMAADIFQKEIYTFDMEHASIMGAVAIVLKVLGQINSLQDFQQKPKKVITPNRDKAKFYGERFQKYMEWYNKTCD
ncbi:MAG: FGGY family carbohydrate kinase [Caldicoprobacterales bacterium]|nr:hypothetical protein [Clostridiales bacterium]